MGELRLAPTKIQVMIDPKDVGKQGTLRNGVVTHLREENYDRAVYEINEFLGKPSDFPSFRNRCERYLQHSISLVRAIEMKRNFPGLNRLTMAKQQDLKLKIKQHVDELVHCLKKVERIEAELRLDDLRSSVLVVRAISVSVFAVTAVALLMDLVHGLALNFFVVMDDMFHDLSIWVYNHFSG